MGVSLKAQVKQVNSPHVPIQDTYVLLSHGAEVTLFTCVAIVRDEMNGVLGQILHCKAILRWGQPGLNEKQFGMNHAPGAGLIAQPVDL